MDFSTEFEQLPLVVDGNALDWLGNGSFLARDGEIIEIHLDHAEVFTPTGYRKASTITTLSRPSRYSTKPNPLWDLLEASILDHYGPQVEDTRPRARADTAPIRISAQAG